MPKEPAEGAEGVPGNIHQDPAVEEAGRISVRENAL